LLETGSDDVAAIGPPPADIYIVIAGKLAPEPTEVERRLFHVSDVSLKGLIQSQMESDLERVYLLTRLTGAKFHLAAIPEDLPLKASSLSFDTTSMQRVFAAGRRFGENEGPWLEIPPGIDPADGALPRSSVTFTRRASSTAGSPAPLRRGTNLRSSAGIR